MNATIFLPWGQNIVTIHCKRESWIRLDAKKCTDCRILTFDNGSLWPFRSLVLPTWLPGWLFFSVKSEWATLEMNSVISCLSSDQFAWDLLKWAPSWTLFFSVNKHAINSQPWLSVQQSCRLDLSSEPNMNSKSHMPWKQPPTVWSWTPVSMIPLSKTRVGAWVLGTHTRSTRVPNVSTHTRTQTIGNISTHTRNQHQSTQYWHEYWLSTSSKPCQLYSGIK